MRLVAIRNAAVMATFAMVLVTSCGDDDDGSPNEANSDQAGSEEFCAAFAPLNEEGEDLFADGAPSDAELQDLLERMRALEPPAEIADDFALVNEAFGLLSKSSAGDPEASAELDERADEFAGADERLEPFMRDVCGVEYGD